MDHTLILKWQGLETAKEWGRYPTRTPGLKTALLIQRGRGWMGLVDH